MTKPKKIKAISYSEFIEKYQKPTDKWDFSLFKIICQKCGSDMVEINGDSEVGYGYYGAVDFEGKIIVKCHKCGNAITKTIAKDSGSSEYCNHD
jgi:ribosomal protein S27E